MKKLIATALAAGALAAAGTASAQDFGGVIANLLGIATPQYGYTYPQQQMYRDQWGRTFYYDQYGRQVYQNNTGTTIIGYDAWGRPVYNTSQYNSPNTYSYGGQYPYTYGGQYPYGTYSYGGRTWDRDGDGVANSRDRWPDDSRYW